VRTLLYFAPVRWDSHAQRPHHIARHFLGLGRVIWIDPYPGRLPRLRDLGTRRPAEPSQPRPAGLEVVRPRAWPIEPLPGGADVNAAVFWRGLLRRLGDEMGTDAVIGVGRPSALAALALRRLTARARFYDAMDDFPAFYRGRSRRALERREREVAARVDRVFVSSAALAEKFRHRGTAAVLLPNALDAASLPPPAARNGTATVLGYVGTIGEWFDWELVLGLGLRMPRAEVRLIGPVFTPAPRALPPNVHLRGPATHGDAMREMADFSCGLIPFKRTPLTEAVDPVKYYEYRGMDLPVLSTRFGEMARRGPAEGVFALDGGEPVERAVETALGMRSDPARALRFREENDWRRRIAESGLFA
jgi:hypothetical protein